MDTMLREKQSACERYWGIEIITTTTSGQSELLDLNETVSSSSYLERRRPLGSRFAVIDVKRVTEIIRAGAATTERIR